MTVVDLERASFEHLPKSFKGNMLLGNGTDMDILRQAGIESAAACFALTQKRSAARRRIRAPFR